MKYELMIEGEIIKGHCPNCDNNKGIVFYSDIESELYGNFKGYEAMCTVCYLKIQSNILDDMNSKKGRMNYCKEHGLFYSNKLVEYMSNNKLTAQELAFKLDINCSPIAPVNSPVKSV